MLNIYLARGIALIAFCALTLCSCGDSDAVKKVELRAVDERASAEREAAPAASVLRISVAAIFSPRFSFGNYEDLARYLEARLGGRVEVSFEKTYAETNERLKDSESDLAFVCTGGYLSARHDFPVEVLAVPVVEGRTVYNSLIVVRKDGGIRRLEDLKGKVLAFSDELSLTGFMYIQTRLAEKGLATGFLGGKLRTGGHDKSMRAVAEGFADVASVNSLVYSRLLTGGDPYVRKLSVLETSPAFANPPLIAREGLSPALKSKVRAVLFGMRSDPDGRHILEKLGVQRFVAPQAGLYSSAEELLKKAARRKAGLE